MTATDTAALVALLRTGDRPPSVYAELVEERGSALAVFRENRGANSGQPGLFDDEAMHTLLATAAADLQRWRASGIRVLTVLDAAYPENLRTIHDRPPLIFVAGALEEREDARSVAVIGARRASRHGIARAQQIARHLVGSGYTVVSGLAEGIDTAAHTAALAAGGRTVAVIGTGLAQCYPPRNAALQRTIAERGAVISQFWPETPPSRRTFPMRNAAMSGFALASAIVEAGERSGARTQARLALNHGRPVFLTSGLKDQAWARELASKPGVHVIDSPEEITRTIERLVDPAPLVA